MLNAQADSSPAMPNATPARHRPETRFLGETGFLILAVLLALALRSLRLDFQPLWWDEGYSVWFATHPLGQMAALTAEDIHPPLYYALLHGWTRLFGAGPAALRLLSVGCGTLTIPAIYLAGQRLFGRGRVPLLAAFLLAISPLHVFYSQEVRMYGLVALLSTGIVVAVWEMLGLRGRGEAELQKSKAEKQANGITSAPLLLRPSAPLLLYVLLTTAALYTQYYAVFLPIGLTLYAAWHWRRDGRALARWLAAQVAVGLLYLPWILYAAPKLVPYVSQKIVADADKPLGLVTYAARHLAAFLAGHLEGPLAPWWPAALVLLVPLVVGWVLLMRRQRRAGEYGSMGVVEYGSMGVMEYGSMGVSEHESPHAHTPTRPHAHTPTPPHAHTPAPPHPHTPTPYLATPLLTALALGWLISLRAPFFPERGERLLILALPAFVLLAAAGLDALWQRWRIAGYVTVGFLVATSVASLTAFYTVPRYGDDDYRALISHTVEQGLPSDTVYCVYPWQVGYWRSYGDAAGPLALLTPATEWGPDVGAALDAALRRGRVWFPAHLALGAILETEIEAHLAGHAVPFVNEWHGPGTRLSAWADAATNSTNFTNEDVGVGFGLPGGGTLALQSVSGSTAAAPAANAVTPIALTWQADAAPPVLAVSVRLTDDLGQIWAQHDYEQADGGRRDVACNVSTTTAATGWCATDRLGLLIPAGTPPGRYHVELALHPKGSQRPLDAIGADGRVLGPAARLYELDVAPADRPLTADRLPIAVRRTTNLEDGVRFLGYSADQTPLTPGELRKVNLFWQAAAQPNADYVAFVQVLGRAGAPVALWEAPVGAAYPSSAWAPGTLMRTQAGFRIPASVPDGSYRLITGLFRADDKARLRTASGADHVALGYITVRGRPHQMKPPTPQYPADASFDATARLVGYDLAATETQPGGTFTLTLHWQALAAIEQSYTIFVHLVDETGALRGFGDAEPGASAFPTTGWLAGEYLVDAHTVAVSADAPPGIYRLAVGFYDPATGERLLTVAGEDRVVLETEIAVR